MCIFKAFFVEKTYYINYNITRLYKECEEKIMKEKRMRKIIGIAIVIAMILMSFIATNNSVYAAPAETSPTTGGTTAGSSNETTYTTAGEKKTMNKVESKDIGDILKAASNWIGGAEQVENTSVDNFVSQFVGIGRILVVIAVVVLLIVIGITGIKWITATPEKQAKLKEQLIGLVVATVVIFGAVGIWNLVRGIMGKVEDNYLTTAKTETVFIAKK
jgi:hypothetical protein